MLTTKSFQTTAAASLTVLLLVSMGDQDVGGLLQAQAEELRLLFSVLVDFKNLVFESSAVDVVLKDIDPVRLGNSFRTKRKSNNNLLLR